MFELNEKILDEMKHCGVGSSFYSIMKNKIVESGDVNNIVDFVCAFSEEIKNAEDYCVEERNPELAYKLLLNCKDADLDKLAGVIIDFGNAEINYKFANEITDEYCEENENVVLKEGEPTFLYLFARDIAGANIEKISQKVLETKNIAYIQKFAKDIEGCNMKKMLKFAKDLEAKELV